MMDVEQNKQTFENEIKKEWRVKDGMRIQRISFQRAIRFLFMYFEVKIR